MKNIWLRVESAIQKRPLRERGIILATALVVMVFLIDTLLLYPDREEKKQLLNRINSLQGELTTLKQQESDLLASISRDPDALLKERIARLTLEVQRSRDSLETEFSQFISPEQMNSALRSLVSVTEGVSLFSLRSLPTETVFAPTADEHLNQTDESALTTGIFRRGVELELTGSFHGLVRYLDMLDELPWIISWEKVQVYGDYPETKFRLRLYTLTLDEGWLRV